MGPGCLQTLAAIMRRFFRPVRAKRISLNMLAAVVARAACAGQENRCCKEEWVSNT
jgi:hypothetical protein